MVELLSTRLATALRLAHLVKTGRRFFFAASAVALGLGWGAPASAQRLPEAESFLSNFLLSRHTFNPVQGAPITGVGFDECKMLLALQNISSYALVDFRRAEFSTLGDGKVWISNGVTFFRGNQIVGGENTSRIYIEFWPDATNPMISTEANRALRALNDIRAVCYADGGGY